MQLVAFQVSLSSYRLLVGALLLFASAVVFAESQPRTITVDGNGKAEVRPDRATVIMSIVVRQPSVARAQEDAAAVTAKVLDLTDRLDISRQHVDTTGASVQPDYFWNKQKGERELRGYIATRRVRVNVLDLKRLGELIEGAVITGVNQVSPPQLDSGSRRDTYRKALKHAATDAKRNATTLAAAMGAELGPVVQINAGTSAPPPMPRHARAEMTMAADGAPETYNAAELVFNTTITAVFELR